MNELRFPIGIQSFPKIIKQGFVYVDKTRYIHQLLMQGPYIFLSRPRRFGKSLLLSTLKAYFEGERELFKGLDADKMDLDWTPSPVIRFDFTAEDFKADQGLYPVYFHYGRSKVHKDKYLQRPQQLEGYQCTQCVGFKRDRTLLV